MQRAIPCMVFRGGTSKGLYFHAADLPSDHAERDQLLLAAMGSPDDRQIDGMGGAHPLTSKVAVVSQSDHPSIDVDYLFLQVRVDRAEVSDSQNCGNILAGVGPFAIESGLVAVAGDTTDVRIRMVNTDATAIVRVQTPGGQVSYEGDTRIDGVPGAAAPVPIDFQDIAGSSCGALLPTGKLIDVVSDTDVTCIDNGMPVVVLKASDFGLTGNESPEALESNAPLKERIEAIRLQAGKLMNLGNVGNKTVPKMCLISPPTAGGTVNTRTFIPHRVHEAIGVLGSVSVATVCAMPGTVAAEVIDTSAVAAQPSLDIEHPTGFFSVELDVSFPANSPVPEVHRAALLRTARLLMRGDVFVPESASVSGDHRGD